MIRLLYLSIFLFAMSASAIAQKTEFRKNAITLETGFFHRGLLGVSYTRNFLIHEHIFLSTSAFGGLGLYYGRYTGLGIDFNLGKKEVFFCAGADFKSVRSNDWDLLFINGGTWQFAWEPHIGMNVITTYGFTGKLLLGYMFAKEPEGDYSESPMLGLSLGCAF